MLNDCNLDHQTREVFANGLVRHPWNGHVPPWRANRSVVHSLDGLADSMPDNIAYTFLVDGEDDEQNITYSELNARARTIGAHLSQLVQPGARVALVYEAGLEYIAALVGCFYAGVMAVPVYPPDPMRLERTGRRLEGILRDSQAELILTTADEYNRFRSLLTQVRVVATDSVPTDFSNAPVLPDVGPDTLALLQYTSGSTGSPKGVMLTHSNLMFNYEHIYKFDEPDGVAVSWLPMYHDMGLIGLVMQALQSGRRTVLMSPLSFVERPIRWLRTISKYRAYATSGPNFAYDLCVQKIRDEDCEQLDLSCWTLACNGAEPIRTDIMERFAQRFEPYGFRWEAFYPCFGLAEATLIVSGGRKSEPPVIRWFDSDSLKKNRVHMTEENAPDSCCLVGCGQSVEHQQIAIADPDTQLRCGGGSVGEIWVKGPGVAQGYWSNREATKKTFQAYIADSGDGPYLRTGDQGFMVDGELFVTGRIKDMLILRGRNLYPQDIERTVEECHASMRRGQCAAFALQIEREERLVIVQGVARPGKLDLDELMTEIRSAVLHDHGVAPYAIALVKGGEIPRTSSGKIQRRECRELYLQKELAIVAHWQADEMSSRADVGERVELCNPPTEGPPDKAMCTSGCHGAVNFERSAVFHEVAAMATALKNGDAPVHVTDKSMLLADLALESIDLVMLNEQIAQRYACDFPITEFMGELGRTNRRDATMGEFVDFIHRSLKADR